MPFSTHIFRIQLSGLSIVPPRGLSRVILQFCRAQRLMRRRDPGCYAAAMLALALHALLTAPAAADFGAALASFERMREARAGSISHERHLPRLLHHGRETPIVVVYFHGLYESPQYSKGIARGLHEQGFNVLSPTLS